MPGDRVASGGWAVEERAASVSVLHSAELDAGPVRRLVRCSFSAPALVLGSTQPAGTVDVEQAALMGYEVVRRRSGGGVVDLPVGEALWVEVSVPAADPLWNPDVTISFHWLGRVWADALLSLGLPGVVHHGGLERGPLGDAVCFGSLGPGEVVLHGRKVVGIAQRRTRSGSRFQCVVYRRWRPGTLVSALAPRLLPGGRGAAMAWLADHATGTEESGAGLDDVWAAFVAAATAGGSGAEVG